MDYNTQRKKLALPEYGRSIHKMVDWVCTIEDRAERNRQIRAVVAIMGNLNPHLRDVNDFKHKLWDHIQLMSNFKIDIDPPYPTPTPDTFQEKPRPIPYSSSPLKIKHYGRNIQEMIEAIANKPDGELKDQLVQIMANHMKKAYITWNKESVSNEIIFRDIEYLSNGRIKVDPNMKLAQAYNLNANTNNSGSGSNKQKNNNKQRRK
ncbi:MAG: DUF4290 domain-containing protein [Prevotellaceae bacterium]|jgi:hypothetical protein|nr:DUF4290 domain-containing protein [Prevotellaceae bacterium]